MFQEKYVGTEALKRAVTCGVSIVRPITDRTYWEAIEKTAGKQVKETVLQMKDYDFTLPAALYLEYVRSGNRSRFESTCFARRTALAAYALLEAMEHKGSYLDDVLNLTWLTLEETTWCLPAHGHLSPASDGLPDPSHPALDLYQAETGSLLAFVLNLFEEEFNKISKNIAKRIKHELNFRVIDNFLSHDDYWWQGFLECRNEHGQRYVVNNWNPWILSNVLRCAAAVTESRERLCSVVEKVMRSLDNYADNYPKDGACDEGPGYWDRAGLSLLDCVFLLHQLTGGYVNEFENEKVKNTAEYIAKVHIGNGAFVNFADCAPRPFVNYGAIYKYGKIMGSKTLLSFAKELSALDSGDDAGVYWEMPRGLELLEAGAELGGSAVSACVFADVYFKSTQVMVSRTSNGPGGLVLAAKGGHNDESHNHNDVGSFIVYKNGEPFLIDPGNEAYCAKTFSDQRYEIWNNRSCFHNTPTIGGKDQSAGYSYCASDVTYGTGPNETVFSLDIKNAYENRDEIKTWRRTFTVFKETDEITLTESFALHRPTDVVLNLMTVMKTEFDGSSKLTFTSDSGSVLTVASDFSQFDVTIETVRTTDEKMLANWGKAPTRIRLKLKEKTDCKNLTFTIK